MYQVQIVFLIPSTLNYTINRYEQNLDILLHING